MPICDGYQACEQITNLFRRSDLKIEKKQTSEAKRSLSLSDELRRPILVALTSFVDQAVHQKTEEAGFDLTVESPLTVDHILKQLKSRVYERRENILRRFQMIQYYDARVTKLKVRHKKSSRNLFQMNFKNLRE